jgi:YidC/Oxa1 family membrane protein insertase
MLSGVTKTIGDTVREFGDLEKLLSDSNKKLRRLVFYGESPIQYRYYEDYIEHILRNSDYEICYLASDPDDPVFARREPRIVPFFIRNTLNTVFSRLDSKVLVIANPDLNKGAVKRAPPPVHHVYAFRGIASTHQGYRLGAFDHYDSLLCVAPYQAVEIRKTEEIYKLTPKSLPIVGYPLVDRLYREHQLWLEKAQIERSAEQPPVCLLAPTWDPFGRASIFDTCVTQLIDELAKTKFEVWIRPHPEFAKRFPKRMEAIAAQAQKTGNVRLQTELASMECIHRADILVTDHSSISFDYVLATERPVLFINTPLRIDNSECSRLGIEPIENKLRSSLGAAIELDKLSTVSRTIESLFAQKEEFKTKVQALRDILVSNWQTSGQVGGNYILDLLKRD